MHRRMIELERQLLYLAQNSNLRKWLTSGRKVGGHVAMLASVLRGRALLASPFQLRFRGAYLSYQEAFSAVPAEKLAGYDHTSLADVRFDAMCKIAAWDYPVLFWLQRLLPRAARVLDAGGHMGTKFRAFQNNLALGPPLEWIVCDVPAIVAAGLRSSVVTRA